MKFVINNRDLADGFFEDCRLLGIMAPVKDYLFCWKINNLLGFDLRINNEIEIQLNRKNRKYFFAVYEYHEPTGSLSHYFYNNHFDGEYLLPEFRHLDYLWLMKGDEVPDEALKNYIAGLRNLDCVQLVSELTNEKIRNKEHLVF